uniref:Alpha/beta hydrolase fold-3 domain-containing protein n=1 Tax=Aegilops tauschii subsp. strangulata TaxID=200361 RepID=A0A452XH96_AEGTS
MHANKTSPANEKDGHDISVDMYPFIRKYKDGSIERFLHSPFVLASPDQGGNRGVATRDVVVDKATGVSVRLFLPSRAAETAGRNRLPLVLYVHGGSFCTESAFGRTYHRYATSLAASAGALVVSVEYRLVRSSPYPRPTTTRGPRSSGRRPRPTRGWPATPTLRARSWRATAPAATSFTTRQSAPATKSMTT